MDVKKPRGTRDFSPDEMHARNYVREQMESVFLRYGYREVLFPTIEHSELFTTKSGEEISEHMYVFKDKGDRNICLRPEATASVCRMFAESLRDKKKPLKLYYYAPMFRYERPQKGRYREFWHLGVELLGAGGPESDAEVINMACRSLDIFGLDYTLEVGHLGILRGLMDDVGVDAKKQDKVIFLLDKGDIKELKKIVDDKTLLNLVNLSGSDALEKAGKLLENHKKAADSLGELESVLNLLDVKGKIKINLGVARGLEYYSGMVFEIRVEGLGAENQVCGGGRYDNLVGLFGGPSTPAVGFAFGFDRVMDALELKGLDVPRYSVDVLLAPVNSEVKNRALEIASLLREHYVVDVDLLDRKLGKILDYGREINARYAVIVGPEDLKRDEITLRDMISGEQTKVKIKALIKEVSKKIG